jgi:hypothetical protein
MGVGKDSGLRAVGLKLNDAAIVEPGINATSRIEGYIFRCAPVTERQTFDACQTIVLLILAGQRGCGGRKPRSRRYRRGPKEQIQNDDHDDDCAKGKETF